MWHIAFIAADWATIEAPDLVGFTLVALFDAFAVIAILGAGAPIWLVVGTGLLIALAGHLTLRRTKHTSALTT
jgi:hypothetical protein